ncbi:hypothetical protein MAPG_00411 [Magnaporthiopsis poae ATCC 64411]|uniref:NmrA-like family domain-containing protein 1 n=1 Tax=Magnaporthiopsis poae (strain ATCC 64411 / 73-15) TaxID=644358 RepID=A0A0C4DKX9_MAGP6|nr:hypothetical protein MAPG_00411 [Magnaporthiopsis poae ATCC 64411]
MAGKKIITVFGATGKQGGSIVNMFVSDARLKEEWAVRGITRDVSKPAAQALAAKGVEVVAADMDDKSSLVKALAGSNTVFAVTNYWETGSKEREIQQGKNIVDAAKENNVQHLILSSLLNVTELTNGKLDKVLHFDSKAEVEAYARSVGIPATFFMPGFYLSNLETGAIRPSPPDNAWTLALPVPADAPIPIFQRVYAASAYMTPDELVAGFRATFPRDGATARFYSTPHADYLAFMSPILGGDELAEEVLQNMRLFAEGGYYGGASLDGTLKLVEGAGEKLTTWPEFLASSKAFKDLK